MKKHLPGDIFTENIDGLKVKQWLNPQSIKVRMQCSTCDNGTLATGNDNSYICKKCGNTTMRRDASCAKWMPNKTATNAGNSNPETRIHTADYLQWFASNNQSLHDAFLKEKGIGSISHSNYIKYCYNRYEKEIRKPIFY